MPFRYATLTSTQASNRSTFELPVDLTTIELIAIAVAPALAIAYGVALADAHEREPLHMLVGIFLVGSLATLVAGGLQLWLAGTDLHRMSGFVGALWRGVVEAALVEELAKFLFLMAFAYPHRHFSEPFDGITYSVMIGMGFASAENLIFVTSDHGTVPGALLRMFTTVPAHAVFAVLMGYFVGLAKFRHSNATLHLTGLIVAICFHGFYDFCLVQQSYQFLTVGSVVALVVGFFLARHAIRLHQQISPYRR